MATNREDKQGFAIGNGNWHCEYNVIDFSDYPEISFDVKKSNTTESVYVVYHNNKNYKDCSVRFSLHHNNDLGYNLQGNEATKERILARLGLMNMEIVYAHRLYISTQSVAKKHMADYEECELTIKELYALGAGADLSAYVGKRTKGENYLVLGNTVEEFEDRNNYNIVYTPICK